jgi:glycosyltransferase involved in cell wall biosynthesis
MLAFLCSVHEFSQILRCSLATLIHCQPSRLMSQSSGSHFRGGVAHPLAGATVLQIIPDLHANAAARATIEIAAALNQIGAIPLVATQGGRLVSELQAKGGAFVKFPADTRNPLNMVLNMRRLARLIRAERVDIVHVRSRPAAWVAYGATRLTKTPLVTGFQGGYVSGGALNARYNSILARGDEIIADSAFAAGLIAKLYRVAPAKLHVIHRGVDCKFFAPNAIAPSRVQAIRREWRVAPDERVVFFTAEAGALSSHQTLIQAVRIVTGQGLPGTKFILSGNARSGGALAKDIDRSIVKAGLQHLVRRADPCTDLPAALLTAAIVIAPSTRPEAFASLAVEAQAMGTPVIMVDVGVAPETVLAPPEIDASLRTGWRIPAANATALANVLIEILNLGATARDRLSLRARAHVQANFSIEQMCAQTLDVYAALQPGAEP